MLLLLLVSYLPFSLGMAKYFLVDTKDKPEAPLFGRNDLQPKKKGGALHGGSDYGDNRMNGGGGGMGGGNGGSMGGSDDDGNRSWRTGGGGGDRDDPTKCTIGGYVLEVNRWYDCTNIKIRVKPPGSRMCQCTGMSESQGYMFMFEPDDSEGGFGGGGSRGGGGGGGGGSSGGGGGGDDDNSGVQRTTGYKDGWCFTELNGQMTAIKADGQLYKCPREAQILFRVRTDACSCSPANNKYGFVIKSSDETSADAKNFGGGGGRGGNSDRRNDGEQVYVKNNSCVLKVPGLGTTSMRLGSLVDPCPPQAIKMMGGPRVSSCRCFLQEGGRGIKLESNSSQQ